MAASTRKFVSQIASKTHPNVQHCPPRTRLSYLSTYSVGIPASIPSNVHFIGSRGYRQIVSKCCDHFPQKRTCVLQQQTNISWAGHRCVRMLQSGSWTNAHDQGESPRNKRRRRQRRSHEAGRNQKSSQSVVTAPLKLENSQHFKFYETYRHENQNEGEDQDGNDELVQQSREAHFNFYGNYATDQQNIHSDLGERMALPFKNNLSNRASSSLSPDSQKQKPAFPQSISGTDTAKQNKMTDVHIEGDTRTARDTYRKTSEKRALKENADPNSASTVAVKIRRQLREHGKKKETENDEDQPVKPKSKDMRHQIQDLSKLQPSTVANILQKSVICNKGDIVAIDKPYGLPSHGGPGINHSIDSLLPKLAHSLAKGREDNPKLHLVHRLDKETTGVMILAKSEETLRRLQAMFRARQVIKKYWVITAGVPDPPQGVIDMPMKEAEIGNRYRMVVQPDLSGLYPDVQRNKRRSSSATDAVTEFKVLDSSKKCALVELQAKTGVKHQIRVHLAQGMACPILGDHKYSHYNKQAPQRLHISTLERLGITQQKVRTVPMHLHAQMVVLPEFFEEGHNLNISTKLPWFFASNMKKLKLKVPF